MYVFVAAGQGLISARFVEFIVFTISKTDLEFFSAFSSVGNAAVFTLNPLENLIIHHYLLPRLRTREDLLPVLHAPSRL
jgi:hypothetical protein